MKLSSETKEFLQATASFLIVVTFLFGMVVCMCPGTWK